MLKGGRVLYWWGFTDGFWGALLGALISGIIAIIIMWGQNRQFKKERKRDEIIPLIKLGKQLESLIEPLQNTYQDYMYVVTVTGFRLTAEKEKNILHDDFVNKVMILQSLIEDFNAKDIHVKFVVEFIQLKKAITELSNVINHLDINMFDLELGTFFRSNKKVMIELIDDIIIASKMYEKNI